MLKTNRFCSGTLLIPEIFTKQSRTKLLTDPRLDFLKSLHKSAFSSIKKSIYSKNTNQICKSGADNRPLPKRPKALRLESSQFGLYQNNPTEPESTLNESHALKQALFSSVSMKYQSKNFSDNEKIKKQKTMRLPENGDFEQKSKMNQSGIDEVSQVSENKESRPRFVLLEEQSVSYRRVNEEEVRVSHNRDYQKRLKFKLYKRNMKRGKQNDGNTELETGRKNDANYMLKQNQRLINEQNSRPIFKFIKKRKNQKLNGLKKMTKRATPILKKYQEESPNDWAKDIKYVKSDAVVKKENTSNVN